MFVIINYYFHHLFNASLELYDLAVSRRLDPDSTDDGRLMAERLHVAARYGQVDGVRQLLDQGVPPDEFRNVVSAAPPPGAMQRGAADFVLRSRGRQAGWTALVETATKGHTDVVRLLLEHGANVNHVDNVSAACVLRAGGACNTGHLNIIIYYVIQNEYIHTKPSLLLLSSIQLTGYFVDSCLFMYAHTARRVFCGSSDARR